MQLWPRMRRHEAVKHSHRRDGRLPCVRALRARYLVWPAGIQQTGECVCWVVLLSEDMLGTLVIGYLSGCSVTLMTMDTPSHERHLFRRLSLWPLYWAYLVVKMGYMLMDEVRR